MRCLKSPQRNSRHTLEDSRQSITSYDLHRCITADNSSSSANKLLLMSRGGEQCTVWVVVHSHSPSRLSFKQALSSQDNSSDSVVSTQRQTKTQSFQSDVHLSVPHTLQCTTVQSYCCSPSLPDRQVHKFTPCSVSLFTSPYSWLQGLLVPTPHSLQQSAQRGDRRGGKGGRKKEQVGTFFRGPVIFYLISQELLDYKSKVCQRKREDNKTQTGALHSSLHQEKSHPRAKPATFLGPLTLFRVSSSLCGLCCGIYK